MRPGLDLKYAVSDARDFAEQIARQQTALANYDAIKTTWLLDTDATAENLRAVLARLAGRPGALSPAQTPLLKNVDRAHPEDTIFIYFAGHGAAVAGRFYLLTHDFAVDGRGAVDPAHAVSDEDLGALLADIDVGRVVLVIDACQSGQVLEAEEKRRGPMNSKGLAQLAYEKGMYILAASQAYQAALEAAQLGHGFLTYALIEEGLKSPAAARGKSLDLRTWLDFATTRVPQLQSAFLSGLGEPARGVAVTRTAYSLQRPRVFYRREPEPHPLIVAVF